MTLVSDHDEQPWALLDDNAQFKGSVAKIILGGEPTNSHVVRRPS